MGWIQPGGKFNKNCCSGIEYEQKYSVVNRKVAIIGRGIILVISNPADILTYKAAEWMKLPNGMAFGSGTILDSSRFVRIIADYVGLNTSVVASMAVEE